MYYVVQNIKYKLFVCYLVVDLLFWLLSNEWIEETIDSNSGIGV